MGLHRHYPEPSAEVRARFDYELGVIQKMQFSGYFLVVWDFIRYAKERGIAVGPGRGSAAASLVAYCLGITTVDPMRYGLVFERFLNPGRKSMPDMDIDFADDRRDEVIEYVVQRYGRERVAQIITFNVLKAKAVIRDVGRVLGMAFGDVDKIAKLVPDTLNITLDDAFKQSPPLAEAVKRRPEVAELWQTAKRLEGLARHAGKHAAGVVISDEPLMEHVPLYRDPKSEEIITQYPMGPIEKLGLLKMDFLGLRTLTVIANTVRLIEESRGVPDRPRADPVRRRQDLPAPRRRADLRRVPAGVDGHAQRPPPAPARAAGGRHRHGGAVPARPDGDDPRLHRATPRAGEADVRAPGHGEAPPGDLRDHGLPGAGAARSPPTWPDSR